MSADASTILPTKQTLGYWGQKGNADERRRAGVSDNCVNVLFSVEENLYLSEMDLVKIPCKAG